MTLTNSFSSNGTSTSRKALEKAQKNVKNAKKFFKEENDVYTEYMDFSFKKSLLPDDIQGLKESHSASSLCFNVMNSAINRQLKNIVDSSPTIEVEPNDFEDQQTSQLSELLTTKIQTVLNNNNFESVLYDCTRKCMYGGKAVIKLKTDYTNEKDFTQDVFIESVADPTTVFFDPADTTLEKSKSNFCFELVCVHERDIEDLYGITKDQLRMKIGSNEEWVSTTQNTVGKIYTVCHYYFKKKKNKTVYMLSDGTVADKRPVNVTNKQSGEEYGLMDGEQMPTVIKKRRICETKMMHMAFVGDCVLVDAEELNFNSLPYIQFIGDSISIDNKAILHPLAKLSLDAQRAKNIIANLFIKEMVNNRVGKYFIAEEAMSNNTLNALRDPKSYNHVPYKAYKHSESGETLQLPMPRYEVPNPLPGEYIEIFHSMDKTISTSLGIDFPSVDQQNMSGKALYNLADFQNAATSSYMQNLIPVYKRLAELTIEGCTNIFETEVIEQRQGMEVKKAMIPWQSVSLEQYKVHVEPGVNFKLQQEANIEKLLSLAKTNPQFAQFLSQGYGFELLVDNMDLNNKSQMIQAYQEFVQQQMQHQMQQPQQPDPNAIIAQAQLMKAQADMAKAQTENQKVANSSKTDIIHANVAASKANAEQTKAYLDLLQRKEELDSKEIQFLINHLLDKVH